MSTYKPQHQKSVDGCITPLDVNNPWNWDLNDFREALGDLTYEAITNDEKNLLLEIPAGGGKSFSAKETIAETAAHQQYFYGTNKHENREEREEEIEDLNPNLKVTRFPNSKRCPIFSDKDEYEEVSNEKIEQARTCGMSIKEAHGYVDEQLEAHDPNNECAFTRKYPDEHEKDASHVLIGSHHHARALDNVEGRRVVLDEFTGGADSHTTIFGYSDSSHPIPEMITSVIQDCDESDINSWGEFLNTSINDKSNEDLIEFLSYLGEIGGDDFTIDNPLEFFDDDTYPHKLTPLVLVTVGLNKPERLGDHLRYETSNVIIVVKPHVDKQDTIIVIEKSDLTKVAKSVTALDASDLLGWWNRYYGLETIRSLKDDSLHAYLDVAFKDLILLGPSDRDSPGPRPYNGRNVTPVQDGGMIRLIQQKHGEMPGVITTMNALNEYEKKSNPDYQVIPGLDKDLVEEVDTMHHGVIRSNRDFENRDVLAVIGSNHLSQKDIEEECLLQGFEPEINDGEGETWTGRTGEVRDKLLKQDTMQAFMRGRKSEMTDEGSVVYVNTDTIPDEYREAFTEWDFDRNVLSSRVRQQAFDAIVDLELEDMIQLNNSCKKKPTISPLHTKRENSNNDSIYFGFTESMVRDEAGLNQDTLNKTMKHFQEKGIVEKVKESRGPNPAVWVFKGLGSTLQERKSGGSTEEPQVVPDRTHPSIKEVRKQRQNSTPDTPKQRPRKEIGEIYKERSGQMGREERVRPDDIEKTQYQEKMDERTGSN